MPTVEQDKPRSSEQTSSAKLPDREELQALIERAAGSSVLVTTNPERDANIVKMNLQAKGMNAAQADAKVLDLQQEYAITFPTQGLGGCLVVLRDFDSQSALYLTPVVRKLSNDENLKGEFRRFEALRSGAMCQTEGVLGEMGFSMARDQGESKSSYLTRLEERERVAATYSEGVAALLYLRDASLSGDAQRIADSRQLVTAVRDERVSEKRPILAPIIAALDRALQVPQSVLKEIKDEAAVHETVKGWVKEMQRPAAQ
ncbi:MAG: hypothetical protein IT290_08620 [Deltaproteobacteria bacterium]|nr:hypothetical protein [Deltaproteobacteria bacterium]